MLCSWGSVVAVSILLTIVGFIIGLIGVSGARRQRAKQWATRYLVGAILVGALAMMALPVAVMGLAVRNAGERSKDATLTAHMTTLQNAVDLYHNDLKRYPARLEDLTSRTNPDPNYNGPYIRAVPQHPYGGTYLLDPITGKVSEKH